MAKDIKNEKSARDSILKAALTLFAKKGFDAVSVREIAKKSGQNLSMISYYFGGKEALYKTIITEHMEFVLSQVSQVFLVERKGTMTAESFKAEIKSMVRIMADMKFKNPEMTALMQREKVDGMPFAREVHEQLIAPVAKQIFEVFKEAQRKKIIKSGFEPAAFLALMIESIHGFLTAQGCGLSLLYESYSFPKDQEKFIEFVATVFTEGIIK